MYGRPVRRWLQFSLLDALGVAILSAFLMGIAGLFIAGGIFNHAKSLWLPAGILFLIGFIWRYFVNYQVITSGPDCGHLNEADRHDL